MGNFALTEADDFSFRWLCSRPFDNPYSADLTKSLIRKAEHLHLAYGRVVIKKFFNLARIDVLTTAHDHVFDAACDVTEAFCINRREITGFHPAPIIDGSIRLLLVAPIALHDAITARPKLALLANRHSSTFPINDFDFHMRMHAANGCNALFQWIIDIALEGDRARLRHAISDGDVAHIHHALHLAHHLNRTGRSGHNACAQSREVIGFKVR